MTAQVDPIPCTSEDASHAEQQALHYSLLARVMNYPDAALYGALHEESMLEALLHSFEQVTGTAPSAEMRTLSEECAHSLEGDAGAALLNLERDYTRLFFASKPRLAYLFESVYREGRLMQDSTFQVARLYHDAGLTLSEEFRLPLDHIAVELEFLSFLFVKQAEAMRSQDADTVAYAKELQDVLLKKHLSSFARELAQRLAQHARHPLYRLAAAILAVNFAAAPETESKPQEMNA